MQKKGKFIVLEGLDGSGTTTQLKNIESYFQRNNINHLLTYEPTSDKIGALIRKILRKNWTTNEKSLQLLFCADRSHHLETCIIPAINEGKYVVCDRYIYSTIAFGSINCDIKWLEALNKYFLKPDLTLYFNTSVKTCLERINKRDNQKEFFEEEDKLIKVKKTYDILSKNDQNTVIIDGEESIETVFDTILKEINKI